MRRTLVWFGMVSNCNIRNYEIKKQIFSGKSLLSHSPGHLRLLDSGDGAEQESKR